MKKGVNMEKTYKLTDKFGNLIGYSEISGEASYRIVFYGMKKGSCIISEPSPKNPMVAMRSADGPEDFNWETKIVGIEDINRMSKYISKKSPSEVMKFVQSFRSTAYANYIGEMPNFLARQAKKDNAEMVFTSNGKIIPLYAQKLPMLVRRDGFMMAQQGVIIDKQIITGEKRQIYNDLLGTDFFQSISGTGLFCLKISGSCRDKPFELPQGEIRQVEASRLVAMTSNVSIVNAASVSDQEKIRTAEGEDYTLTLQANVMRGKIYLSDQPQDWKFHGMKYKKKKGK